MKKILIGIVSFVLLLLMIFFLIIPWQVDRQLNRFSGSAGYRPSARAAALYKKLFIADLHSDFLIWDRDLNARYNYGHVDVPRLIDGNISLQTFSIVSRIPFGMNIKKNQADAGDLITLLSVAQLWPPRTWSSLKQRALYQADRLMRFSRRSDGKLTVIKSTRDLNRYLALREKNPSMTAGLLAVEGAQVLEGNLENIETLYRAGFRMMSHVHFYDNDMGGSAHGSRKGGLTEKGKQMIAIMERNGMIVDLAHASPTSLDDILAIATRPVVVSHTGVKGACDNIRNISDRHITAIARTGGVIGIAYFPFAICGSDIAHIVKSIRYAVSVAGIEHVGLGSDFDGSVSTPFDTAGLIRLVDALLESGFTEEQVGLIMGGNTLRVLRQVLPKN